MSTPHSAGGTYDSTSGSDDREARPMMEAVMAFDIGAEIERLRDEAEWRDGDRNSRTLAKDVDFRVLLSVLRPDARLNEEDGDARVSIHLLDGGAQLDVNGKQQELAAGSLAVVDAGQPWALTATADCAVLLTLAWPREKAQPGGADGG